jgi:sugar-specific transcriptional regulator TrmB
MTVRGHDLLGRPFEEPTTTASFNLHGCRYTSKYHLPKNTWVTLRVKRGCESTDRRARVTWVQRPRAIREFFQVAVEFEKPANIWALEAAPLDWTFAENVPELASTSPRADLAKHEDFAVQTENNSGNHKEKLMDDLSDAAPFSESASSDSVVAGFAAADPMAEPLAPEHAGIDTLLRRELSAELERRARQALDGAAARASEQVQKAAEGVHQKNLWASEEAFRKWKEEFEAAQNAAREQGSAQHNELLSRMRSEFDESLGQAKRLVEEIEKNRTAPRGENDAAADAQLKFETLEPARIAQLPSSQPMPDFSLEAIAKWRERLESEMRAAQSQLNKLLESSLDTSVQRIAAQLAAKSEDFLRESESLVSNRFKELSQPLLDSFAQARESAIEVKSALDEELARAKASLAEIEQAAARINDFSGHIDTATREALDELNRQLQAILYTQAQSLGQRAEALTAATIEKVALSLEALKEGTADPAAAEIESKLAPHLERVPQILHEPLSCEVQVAESLRMHRERSRQYSERNEKELIEYLNAAVEVVRGDFEATRKDGFAKWNEQLEACGARAAHAAAESIDKAAQWTEQDARARLQTLLEQTLTAAGTSLHAKVGEAKHRLDGEFESAAHANNIRQQLDASAAELTVNARTQIEQAAEATAAGIGEVLRRASDQEVELFRTATLNVVPARTQELDNAAQLLRHFEANAESSLANFQSRIASQLEASIAEGRTAFSNESNAVLAALCSEQEAHQKAWTENLDRLSDEVVARYRERLETTADSWIVSSVRRLNEHGQNAIDLLARSSHQALRYSCARFFDDLFQLFRGRNAAGQS